MLEGAGLFASVYVHTHRLGNDLQDSVINPALSSLSQLIEAVAHIMFQDSTFMHTVGDCTLQPFVEVFPIREAHPTLPGLGI